MIPTKDDKHRTEYINLHYKIKQLYRRYYPHIPFRHIQKTIHRKWQIICYNRINNHSDYTEHTARIKWSQILEVVKTI
jgi:hypothetical protein